MSDDTLLNHKHKYFAFQIKKDFESVEIDSGTNELYKLVEYVYSACSCGAAIKSKVVDYD